SSHSNSAPLSPQVANSSANSTIQSSRSAGISILSSRPMQKGHPASRSRVLCQCSGTQRHDDAVRGVGLAAIFAPLLHETAALLEEIGAPIGPLHSRSNDVAQHLFNHMRRVGRALMRPIAKGASEAVRDRIAGA